MTMELYHFESCPYCAKVRRYIDEIGAKSQIQFHDILKDPKSHERLMKLNNDEQVPCLVVDGKPILESDDIIAWLKDHFKK
jgi:glutaredoxin